MSKITIILLVLGALVGVAVGSYLGTWLATRSLRAGSTTCLGQQTKGGCATNQLVPLNQQPTQPQQPMAPGQGNQLPQQQQPNQNQSAPNQPTVNQPMPN